MKGFKKALICTAAMFSIVACGTHKSNASDIDEDPLIGEQSQTEFEESYIKGSFTYGDGQKFAISMLSNIGTIAAGIGFDSPTTVVSGIFSLLGTINDNLNGSNGPTIANVMNKLNEMDTKLDELNAKIDKNYAQLATEEIRTQAMVDQVLLNEQEKAIRDFNTDYVVPVENYRRNFSDYIEQSYKSYISVEEEADIYVSKNEKNEWTLVPITEQGSADQKEIKFAIADFTNSKTFLDKNYGVVTTGFIDRFNEDIDKALKDVNLPEGLSKTDCRNYVAGNIVERFTKKYYVDNVDKAQDIRNMAINYAKQINGKAVKSVIDGYISRLEYMYNFAGEMKNSVTDAASNLMLSLDTNVALAAEACLYAGMNQEELKTEYMAARDLIKSYYDGFAKINNKYCFVTNSVINGGFYKAQFNTYYTNKGNDCRFNSSFDFYKANAVTGIDFVKDDVNSHNYVNELDNLRISTRMGLMRENGLTNANSYIEYLDNAKILETNAYKSYQNLLSEKWIDKSAFRVFTGLSIRDMNDGDRNFTMTCNEAGNPGGDYFYTGWRGTYKGAHGGDYWSGKIAESTFIDGNTGKIMTDKRVAAYATYNESHCYWFNDEHWSFVDDAFGNFFFILEHVC